MIRIPHNQTREHGNLIKFEFRSDLSSTKPLARRPARTLSAGSSSFYSFRRIYANSASSVTSQLISLRYIPGSVPFADTSRVWMDFFVRVTVR